MWKGFVVTLWRGDCREGPGILSSEDEGTGPQRDPATLSDEQVLDHVAAEERPDCCSQACWSSQAQGQASIKTDVLFQPTEVSSISANDSMDVSWLSTCVVFFSMESRRGQWSRNG